MISQIVSNSTKSGMYKLSVYGFYKAADTMRVQGHYVSQLSVNTNVRGKYVQSKQFQLEWYLSFMNSEYLLSLYTKGAHRNRVCIKYCPVFESCNS